MKKSFFSIKSHFYELGIARKKSEEKIIVSLHPGQRRKDVHKMILCIESTLNVSKVSTFNVLNDFGE